MVKKNYAMCVLTMVCCLMFLTTGCAQAEIGPEVVVGRFLRSIENKDYFSAVSYLHNETSLSQEDLPAGIPLKKWKALADTLVDKTSYETPVVSFVSETEAVVGVKFVTVDCASVYKGLESKQSAAFEVMLNNFQSAVAEENAPVVALEVAFTVTKSGDSWRIILDDALVNALTGNLLDTLKEAGWLSVLSY